MIVKCVARNRDALKRIREYVLQDTLGCIRVVEACTLKEAIATGKISCVNLTLSKDGRLVFKNTTSKSKKNRIDSILIKLRALGANIVADDCFIYRKAVYGIHRESDTISLDRCMVTEGEITIPQFVDWINIERSSSNKPFENSVSLRIIDNSSITNLGSMFLNCEHLTNIEYIKDNNVSVHNMAKMFLNCERLETVKLRVNTDKNTSTAYMFANCNSLRKIDLGGFDTSNVTEMHKMFSMCTKITELNLRNFNTLKVRSMNAMFAHCRNLKKLDLSNFYTPCLELMTGMFFKCSLMSELNIQNLDTHNVQSMQGVFSGCSNLTTIDIRSFDTLGVTDMESMFSYCEKLKVLKTSSKFNTINVVTMQEMFKATGFERLDLRGFDTRNVENTNAMFKGAKELRTIDISSFNTDKVKYSQAMFCNCVNLEELDMINYSFKSVDDIREMFYNCPKLKVKNFPNIELDNGVMSYAAFEKCTDFLLNKLKNRERT